MTLPINQFLIGDNVDVLMTIDSDSVDLVVTSPPYGKLMKNEQYCVEYNFCELKAELYRVLKPGGQLCWNEMDQAHDGNESGLSFRHCIAFQDYGFNLVRTIIYAKLGGPRVGDIRLLNPSHEYIFWLSKGFPKTVNILKDIPNISAGRIRGFSTHRDKKGKKKLSKQLNTGDYGGRNTVWSYGTGIGNSYDASECKMFDNFPAPMPQKLAGDLIQSFSNPGDVVLDPFGGAGTTAKMAMKLNRNFIYIEIIPANAIIAKKRVAPYINKIDQWVQK
jgi:site-specific DNA-methyltransferase (adenine-specific)